MKHLPDSEKGSGLLIMVMVLGIVIVMMALALDGSSAVAARRQAQNAADAAAIAGVQALRDDGAGPTVAAAITQYAERNEVGVSEWTYLYDLGETVGVVVTTTTTVPTFFARTMGTDAFAVFASAEARRVQEWVLFANNTSTDQAITIVGNNLVLEGSIHSNGGVYIQGNGNQILGGRTESVRKFHLDGIGNSLDLDYPLEITAAGGYQVIGGSNQYPLPTYTANTERMPRYELDRNLGSYGPAKPGWLPAQDWHYYDGSQTFRGTGAIFTGLYYVDGDLTLNGTSQSGTATFVATGDITLDGSGQSFMAYDGRIVLYAGDDARVIGNNVGLTGIVYAANNIELDGNRNSIQPHDHQPVLFADNGGIEVTGNSQSVAGVAYAPRGATIVDGNSLSLPFCGGVVADTIQITGNSARIIYDSSYSPKDKDGSTVIIAE